MIYPRCSKCPKEVIPLLNLRLSWVGHPGKEDEEGEIKITYRQLNVLQTLLDYLLENYQVLEVNELKMIRQQVNDEIMAIM